MKISDRLSFNMDLSFEKYGAKRLTIKCSIIVLLEKHICLIGSKKT